MGARRTIGWCRLAVLAGIAGGLLILRPAAMSAAKRTVPAGGDLQAALDAAQPGDIVELAPGAVYSGNFVLRSKAESSAFITVRSAPDPALPREGERIQPSHAPLLAKLRSPNGRPALATAPRAHHWRLELLEFQSNAGGSGDIITLGDGSRAQNALDQVPHHLIVDRCYVHGDAEAGQKRGIALNTAATTISGSYISDIKAVGQDAQAIAAWNGPGPFTITNNYLEAAAENVLFGGADPSIRNLVPSDITFTHNLLSRPVSWRGERWQVKNILELKNARRATITGNVLENNWLAAQVGFAVLFTVRNQEGQCPWCQVEQVVFEGNVVQHSSGGIKILGYDDSGESQQTRDITIRNNLFADIDNTRWGGTGYFLLLVGNPRDIVIDGNTVIQEHGDGILQVEGPPVLGFVFTNNITRHNAYGIKGANRGIGSDTVSAFFPASLVRNNVMADGDAARYPAGNYFPSSAEFRRQFIAYGQSDFRLAPSSAWGHASTTGTALGANISAITAGRALTEPERPTRPLSPKGRPLR
jgi:hypothetical protein